MRKLQIKPSRHLKRPQRGATLIEILIALLILSLGILGLAAMQIRALKGNHSSMQRTQAVLLSYYILDAMRVDSNSAKSLNYNTGALDGEKIGAICDPAAITGTSLADKNNIHWIQSLKANIGQATDSTTCGAILCDADGYCRVQVTWDDSRAGGMGEQIIDTRSRL